MNLKLYSHILFYFKFDVFDDKQWQRSYSLLKEMLKNDLNPNAVLFNTVIRALVAGGDTVTALNVLKTMERSPRIVNPNRSTYQIIITALIASNRPVEAETMLSVMVVKGMKPEVELYTLTVRAYEKLKKPGLALSLMEKMRKNGYDFYDIPMVNKLFKHAVELANNLSPVNDEEQII